MPRQSKSKSALDAPIISSIKSPIPTKELLARLSKIADELSAVDQEHAVLEEYRDIATKLANIKLIKHKHIGIQAFSICAIADIIRLFAPDAPFTSEELSNIFRAIIAQFSHLWDGENPYFLQQSYILKRIVEVRSIVLIEDLPDSQQILTFLFDTMYNLTTKGFPSKLEHLASELLAETIAETEHIPQDVVSMIIKRLTISTESQLTGGSSNISNPAFAFSLAICEANGDKMARHVAQLFSEMLDESAKLTREKDGNAPFKALEKIHQSSIQIWAHVPDLLASVMGLISGELNSDDESIRVLATKTIGSMLSSSSKVKSGNSAVTFVSYHKDTWINWLKKSSDHSSSVRSAWIEQLPGILDIETTSEINQQLSSGLCKCLIDSSEKVRLSSCRVIELMQIPVILKKVCDAYMLKTLCSLIREKQAEIRMSAINILANLYNNCMKSILKNEIIDLGSTDSQIFKEVIALIVHDIPNNILQLNYINDKSITAAVDVTLFEKLLPFDDSASVRVHRLCKFIHELDDKSKHAFIAITKRQKKNVEVLLKFLDLAEEYASTSLIDDDDKENTPLKTEISDQMLSQVDKIATWLSVSMPDNINPYECIELFFHLKNLRFINLLKNCLNSQSDYKTVKNSARELLTGLNDAKNLKRSKGSTQVTTSNMLSCFKILLYRSSAILYNKSNTSELIQASKDDTSELQPAANELIGMISTNSPGVFKAHIATLADIIKLEEHSNVKISVLKSLYHILVRFPECSPSDEPFFDLIHSLSTTGSYTQAKYCLKIVGCSTSKEYLVKRILSSIFPLDINQEHFATHLSAIAEIYLIDPLALSSHTSEINSVIIEDILKHNRLSESQVAHTNGLKWIDDTQLPFEKPLIEKLLSIRIITNRLRNINSINEAESLMLTGAKKHIDLLANIIFNDGEIVRLSVESNVIATPACYRSRLRLTCGLMLLKLAMHPQLNVLISTDVLRKLTRLLFDEQTQVREAFAHALQKNLQDKRISEKFLHLVFFMGHESNSELKTEMITWILSQHHRSELKNDMLYERLSTRLIHALAHDDKFCKILLNEENLLSERELNALSYISGFVAMFIGTIANEKNVSLLYYLASRVKQYRDNLFEGSLYDLEDTPSGVLNLYRVAELFQLMLKDLADSKSWNLETWPGKMNLPKDLYSPMENYQQAQRFVSRIYISDSTQVKLREFITSTSSRLVKRKASRPHQASKVKKPRSTTQGRKKSRGLINASPRAPRSVGHDAQKESPAASRRSTRSATKVYYGESEDEEQSSENESNDEFTAD